MARPEGEIKPLAKNKFLVKIFLGVDGRGDKKYKSKTFYGSEAQAEKLKRKMLQDRDDGLFNASERTTLGMFLDKWLETSVKPHVRAKSFREYSGSLSRYIREPLGGKKLNKITTLDLQSVYSGMLARGLSGATVLHVHAVLREALDQAVKWQMLTRNPADFVDLPKQRTKSEMYALDQREIETFRKFARSSKWYVLFELLLGTGLRPSEALGLTWRNVDLAKGTLAVVQKLSKHTNNEWQFDEPKTVKGRRSITLPGSIVTLLSDYFDHQKAQGLPNPYGLLFHTVEGLPASENSISQNVFKPLILKAGLPKTLRLYDLRHTHATLLLIAGVHPKVVSERLGHANIKITLDTYSHVLPNMQQEAAEKLEALVYAPENEKRDVDLRQN